MSDDPPGPWDFSVYSDRQPSDRGRPDQPDRTPPAAPTWSVPEIITVAEFVGTAVASGVIGNLFYDALKQTVRKFSPSNASKDEEDLLPELVFHAVIEQCRRYKLAVPEPDRMRLDKWERSGRWVVAHVSCMDSEMTAEVTLSGRQGSSVEVRIRDVSQRAAITRVAKKEYYEKYPRRRPRRSYRVLLTSVVVLVVALLIYLVLR